MPQPSRALAAQWLATLYAAAVSLGVSAVLARAMGPGGYGLYAYGLGLAAILALGQDAGFRTLLLRERVMPTPTLAGRVGELPGQALAHLLVATPPLMLAAWLAPGGGPGLAAAIACFAAVTLGQWLSAWLKGNGRFGRAALWQAMSRTASAALILAVVLVADATPGRVFIAQAAGLLLALAWFRRDFPARLQGGPAGWAYRAALGFLSVDMATTVYHRVDIVILHQVLGSAAGVGQYAAAYRLFDGALLLIAPAAQMFFRALRLVHPDPAAVNRLMRRGLRVAVAAGLALAAGGWLLGAPVAGLLYGPGYAVPSGRLVGWLFCALPFVLPNAVLTQAAIALNRERWYAGSAAFAAAANLALNVALVPRYGADGAAWATVATEAALGLALWAGLVRHGRGVADAAG